MLDFMKAFLSTPDGGEQTKEQPLSDHVKFIQEILGDMGIGNDYKEISKQDGGGYVFEKFAGSAGFYIGLRRNETLKANTIFFMAPILRIPQDNQLEFYKKCLELNDAMVGCALSLDNDIVRVVADRELMGLDEVEFKAMMHSVALSANDLDDRLSAAFGAQMLGLGLKKPEDAIR